MPVPWSGFFMLVSCLWCMFVCWCFPGCHDNGAWAWMTRSWSGSPTCPQSGGYLGAALTSCRSVKSHKHVFESLSVISVSKVSCLGFDVVPYLCTRYPVTISPPGIIPCIHHNSHCLTSPRQPLFCLTLSRQWPHVDSKTLAEDPTQELGLLVLWIFTLKSFFVSPLIHFGFCLSLPWQ